MGDTDFNARGRVFSAGYVRNWKCLSFGRRHSDEFSISAYGVQPGSSGVT